jgi:PAS domain S-box-containing protein
MSSDQLSPLEQVRQIEEELRLHDRAMAASSCGITIADARQPDMPLIYINEAFEEITGYPTAEVLGKNCRFLQGEDRSQPELDELRAALKQGSSCRITIRNYRKDGSLFWNELFMAPVFDHAGQLTHYVGVQTDVTARKLVEEALTRKTVELERALTELRDTQVLLVHSEKMSALGQMVAGVAHEINNPISFVNSNLHSFKQSVGDLSNAYDALEGLIFEAGSSAEQEAARRIRQQAELDYLLSDVEDLLAASFEGLARVRKIVEALRTFSRLDEADLKIANIGENIRSTLLMARGELQGKVEVQLDVDDLPDIKCYPAELNQVFLNIIINAAQAVQGKGLLAITGRDLGDSLELRFADSGVGIAPDVIDNIFNPFFTTKPVGAGTGLGLSIAHKIITDRHRGTIRVESAPGAGTTFIITLPKELKP